MNGYVDESVKGNIFLILWGNHWWTDKMSVVLISRASCIQTLKGHRDNVNCIHVDSTRIISVSFDHRVRIWDFNSWVFSMDRLPMNVSCHVLLHFSSCIYEITLTQSNWLPLTSAHNARWLALLRASTVQKLVKTLDWTTHTTAVVDDNVFCTLNARVLSCVLRNQTIGS